MSRRTATVEMAVSQINENGGLLGQTVEIVVADNYCDSEQAVAAAKKLIALRGRCGHRPQLLRRGDPRVKGVRGRRGSDDHGRLRLSIKARSAASTTARLVRSPVSSIARVISWSSISMLVRTGELSCVETRSDHTHRTPRRNGEAEASPDEHGSGALPSAIHAVLDEVVDHGRVGEGRRVSPR